MIAPVFTPPVRIDATNVAAFAESVAESVSTRECMVIDCSQVEWIAAAAMRVMEIASRNAHITLLHPSPAVHLMAATYGIDVRLRDGSPSSRTDKTASPTSRLVSVHTDGKVAS